MKISIVFLALLILSSCSVTGPAQDADDIEKEDVLNFGTLSFWEKKDGGEKSGDIEKISESDKALKETPTNNLDLPQNTGKAFYQTNEGEKANLYNEFESYQQWLRDRESNSQNYKDFKEYQNWLEFRKNKSSQ